MRVLALVDGEHFPPVVRAAIERLSNLIPGSEVVAAVLVAGGEKLRSERPELGIPVVVGSGPEEGLTEGLRRFTPDAVADLCDEPAVDGPLRLRLAARALAAGAAYVGADFRFDPPPRPRLATKPSIAVVGTGKRTGKTAVAASMARILAADGRPPVIVAMGRGGPTEPELIDPRRDAARLTPKGLVALADRGRHAASDHLEDAIVAGVATIGTRRCGGGFAGAPVDATFAAGVALANQRHERLVVFEGSGRAMPPAHADATVCVVPVGGGVDHVVDYLGAYRLLLSDAVVITMSDKSLAEPGAVASLEKSVRGLAPGGRLVHTVFRPFPLAPISGRRVVFATTAPRSASEFLRRHLEEEHGGKIVDVTHHLADRRLLAGDLQRANDADVLLVELKASAIDLAARFALERGMQVVFCDNRVMSVGGDISFEGLSLQLAGLATERFAA